MKSAEVLVKFKGDTKDLDEKTSQAKSSLKGFASGIGTAFKVATGAVVGCTTALVGLIKTSIDGYAEFEQLEGGLISLFGEGSTEMNRILKDSEEAYKTLTMSQNDYLTNFQSSYPLVNAGLSENADGIEYTNKMLQLSSDLFNTYGGSIDQYQNAINWALKGSFVYLDNLNLGIKGTQEGFIEAANSSGVLKREISDVKDLTSDEIIDVIQHYAEAYGVWGKTGQEASETIIGSMNMVKATWSNFITGLSKDGADIDKLIDQLVNSVMTFVGNIVPVIMRALDGIASALPKLAEQLGEILPGLIDSLLPPLIKALTTLINAVIKVIPGLIRTAIPLLMEALLSIIQALVEALPDIISALIEGIVVIIQALADSLPTLMPLLVQAIIDGFIAILDNIDIIIDAGIQLLIGLIQGLIQALPILIEKLPEIIIALSNAILDNLPKILELGITILVAIAQGLVQAIPKLIEKIPEIMSKLWDAIVSYYSRLFELGKELLGKIINGISSAIGGIFNVGKDLVMGLWNGIVNVKDWIIGKIKGFGNSVLKAIKGIFGVHSPSTEFEWIGKMNMVGLEQGMESMKDKVQSTIDSAFNLQPNINGNMSSTYSPQMNVIVQNNMELDPLGQVVNQIKTFSGGAKNDYNWGAGL
jgi:phage-related protein